MTTNQDLQNILFDGLEEKLWNAANQLRSNSTLKTSEYVTPVLDLIFLKFTSSRFELEHELVKGEIQPFDDEESIKKMWFLSSQKRPILLFIERKIQGNAHQSPKTNSQTRF